MKFAVLSACVACVTSQDVFLSSKKDLSRSDLLRAKSKRQGGQLAGSSAQEIADKLNTHIRNVGGAARSCEDHSQQELNDITRNLLGAASDELQDIYRQSSDVRGKRFASLAEYEESWAKEIESDTLSHAKCFEIGELWAHHLSESAKKDTAAVVPQLPVYETEKAKDEFYAEATSCQTGHAMVKGGDGASTHEWPDWPEELHYKAKGHGAYPFWWGGGSDSGTADLEVWWSEKQGYELFYHSSCSGLSSWQQGECYHLMLAPTSEGAAPLSYLFDKDAHQGNGGNCCLTNPTAGGGGSGQTLTLNPSQGTFWNTFQDMGEVDFNGVYYQGKAKYYLLTNVPGAIADFWYFTDLDGKPVQQGEAGTGPTDQGYPTSFGHTIWHDYDPSTFDTAAQDSSIATVPDVCKTTTSSCAFP